MAVQEFVRIKFTGNLNMRFRLPELLRHRVGPGQGTMRVHVRSVELDRSTCELERFLLPIASAKHARMRNMLDGMHVGQSAISRHELRCSCNYLGELNRQSVPVLRIKGSDQRLAAQPSVVHADRDIGLLRKATQAIGRQVDVEGHGDAPDDAPLRFEPVVEAQLEAIAPDEEAAVELLQHDGQLDSLLRLIGEHLDLVPRVFVLVRAGRWMERHIGHLPFPELDQRGKQELAKTQHEMRLVRIDLGNIDTLQRQHQPYLVRAHRNDRARGRRRRQLREADRLGERRLGTRSRDLPFALVSPHLDLGNKLLRRGRGLHAIFFVEQVPQRSVNAQGLRGSATARMSAHQAAARIFMSGIEVDDGFGKVTCLQRIVLILGQSSFQSAQQAIAQGLAFGEHPNSERRIKILEAGEQIIRKVLPFEKQRMHLALFRRADHGPHIHVDRSALESDILGGNTQTATASIGKNLAQLPNDLTQHATRLRLARLAPQQPNQPFACFHQRFTERDVAQNRAQLQALDLKLTAIAPKRNGTEQGKLRRELRFHLLLPRQRYHNLFSSSPLWGPALGVPLSCRIATLSIREATRRRPLQIPTCRFRERAIARRCSAIRMADENPALWKRQRPTNQVLPSMKERIIW